MLSIRNISKSFNGLSVLKNLSFDVKPGDFVVLMGPNGTGKSTLFDILSGKTKPDEGSLYLENQEISSLSERKRSCLVGRLFQNTYLGSCSSLTIRENLAMATLKQRQAGFTLGIKRFPEKVVKTILEPLNLQLENLLDVPMGALSGGQRQIISFIMSILYPPKILLLDEPTAALDPNSATKLLLIAKDFAEEHRIPIFLITHDPLIAKHLGNRLWILGEGSIQRELGPEKKQMNPQDFFHSIHYEKIS